MSKYHNIASDESVIQAAVQRYGVLSLSITAISLVTYSGGITRVKCDSKLDHEVSLVGWGEEDVEGEVVKYWIVRNSWGKDWGEEGYFRASRDKGYDLCVSTDIQAGEVKKIEETILF